MPDWLLFCVGVFVGVVICTCTSVLVLCLCKMSGKLSQEEERDLAERMVQESRG